MAGRSKPKKGQDEGYEILKSIIRSGEAKDIQRVFKYFISTPVVAKDCGLPESTLRLMINNPLTIKWEDMFRLSIAFDVDIDIIVSLVKAAIPHPEKIVFKN